MKGHHAYTGEFGGRSYGTCHGIRNVAEFQVKKYARDELGDSPQGLGTFGSEQLAANFDQVGTAAKLTEEFQRLGQVREI
jgi:hypothetical protein